MRFIKWFGNFFYNNGELVAGWILAIGGITIMFLLAALLYKMQ